MPPSDTIKIEMDRLSEIAREAANDLAQGDENICALVVVWGRGTEAAVIGSSVCACSLETVREVVGVLGRSLGESSVAELREGVGVQDAPPVH